MDRDLVEQAREGDREAFTVLVHQVSDSLYAVAHRILRDTGLAEDALQNALVLAWRRLPKLGILTGSKRGSIGSSCMPATTSRAGQILGRYRPVLPMNGPSTPDERSLADRDELERAFRQLSIEQRAVFVLHHYVGLPLVEIAELLDIPPGRPDRACTTHLPGSATPSWPRRSRSPGKDDSHDRRSIN